jgi:hypothetical protein
MCLALRVWWCDIQITYIDRVMSYMGIVNYNKMIEVSLSCDFVALKRAVVCCSVSLGNCLSTFASDTAGKLDVLWHNGDTFCVDGTQVGILKKTNQVSLASFLESHDGGALESEISLEVLGDFSYQTLEWQFSDQELGALLVSSDLSESDGSWPVPVRLLHSAGGGCALTGSFGSQLLPRSLSSGRFSGCLLCSGHRDR